MSNENIRRIRLLRSDGTHRCWISRMDRQKLMEGGHVAAVDPGTVRLLSDTEKRETRRSGERVLEAAGVRVARRRAGLGKIW